MGRVFDKIIIGAGLYGMYAALYCAKKGQQVLLLEYDEAPFQRATYINQARVHMGYHYPRSLSTAVKSAGYFRRFVEEFGFCIHSSFSQIYATSSRFSWTDRKQFESFCQAAGIRCEEVPASAYFREGMCDGAFLTEEYTYDAVLLRDFYVKELAARKNVQAVYGARIERICREGEAYRVDLGSGQSFAAGYILNASYASANQILQLAEGGFAPFDIKYELCEIILCRPSKRLEPVGITVMDGPFFSIMPFGRSGYHSLTSVTFTPHVTSYKKLPGFLCQRGVECSPDQLANCNTCPARPESAWQYMDHLARKYMREEYEYEYVSSLFSMKPILKSSEVDDSRPTRIRVDSEYPHFVSVLSGKINTVYDLEEFL
ncbi:MAG: FAD-binding oxidoreductase [Lachnospiraceae bacterium]|nr:FAD-binding oxidoreductase [Lachnospiraceae bacterium]